jgi:uncharacterized protein YciI
MELDDLVRAVEESIDKASSWDSPASLWLVHDLLEERLTGVSVSFLTTLDGHPAHALELLYAPSDAHGVVLITEGYAYSAARRGTNPSEPPSAYKDSNEVRLAHIILRTGEEAMACRTRGELEPVISIASTDETRPGGTALTGRVTWALRRALRLPSHAEDPLEGPLEPTSSVRVRLAASVLLTALQDAAKRESHEAAHLLLLGALTDVDLLLRCGPFSLHHDSWDDAYNDALTVHNEKLSELADSAANDPTDSDALAALEQHEYATRRLTWLDAPMWARRLADTTPSLAAASSMLLSLVKQGVLNPQAAEIISGVFSLQAPYGSWASTSKPGRNAPCPCGSQLRFKLCHGRLA